MKIVRICIYSGPYFPTFGLNTDQNNSQDGQFLRSVRSDYFFLKADKDIVSLYIGYAMLEKENNSFSNQPKFKNLSKV